MITEEMMHIHERREYLRIMQARYLPADRQERGRLLHKMEAMTGLDRKTLIRSMRSDLQRRRRRRERGAVHGAPVQDAIQVIAETLDYPCAERLTPGLAPTARQLATHGELELPPELEALYNRTNPRLLRQAIYDALEQLWALPGAVPDQPEDVRLPLYTVSQPTDVVPVVERLFRQALDHSRQASYTRSIAMLESSFADWLMQVGDERRYPEAESLLRESLEYALTHRDEHSEALVLNRLAVLLTRWGGTLRLREAEACLSRSLDLWQRSTTGEGSAMHSRVWPWSWSTPDATRKPRGYERGRPT